LTKQKKRRRKTGKAAYQPIEEKNAALSNHRARTTAAPKTLAFKVTTDGKLHTDHPNAPDGMGLLMNALGTADQNFATGLVHQLVKAGSQGNEPGEHKVNFMLSVINGIEPRDHLEAMLAAQMAAIHMATMTLTQQLACVANIPQQDSAERALNKLARTYASQMEALKRYRTGGEQKVTVQHVTVSEGGQAIVGNVTQAKRDNADGKAAASSPRALTHAKDSPMPMIDEKKEPASVPARRARKK
jgi:hypothetical protein